MCSTRRYVGFFMPLLVVAALTGATGSAADSSTDSHTSVGLLVEQHGDSFATGRESAPSFAVESGGRVLPLHLSRKMAAPLVGRRVRVAHAHGRTTVVALPGRRLSTTAGVSGAKRVAVLLVNFSNDTSQPFTPAFAAGVAFTNSNSVAAYYSDSSWGQLSLSGDVYGWYTLPDSDTSCNTATWANDANKAASAAGVNLGGYTNIVYAFPLASSCSWNGWADLPGTRSWLNGPSAMTLQEMAHELGHNFGLNHASSYVCTVNGVRVALAANPASCTIGDYGDPFSVMGAGKHYGQTNFARGVLGWLSAANTQTVTTSGDYALAPIEAYDPTGVDTLRMQRTSGTYFTLELRQSAPLFDTFSSTDSAVTGVSIRVTPASGDPRSLLVDTTPGSMMSYFDAPLALGKTLVDPLSGISITVVDISPLGALVRLALPGSPVTVDTTPPSQPAGLVTTNVDSSDAGLVWTASTDNVGVTGYRVYRNSALVATVTSPGYADSGLTAGTTYSYDVIAFDAAGNSSIAASLSATTTAAAAPVTTTTATTTTTTTTTTMTTTPLPPADMTAPSAPTNLTGSVGKGKKVSLAWSASGDNVGVAGYTVYRNGASAGTTSSTGFTDSPGGKTVSATYYVVAYDAAGNVSSASSSVSVQG
jgi:chitodextrinase